MNIEHVLEGESGSELPEAVGLFLNGCYISFAGHAFELNKKSKRTVGQRLIHADVFSVLK